MHNIISYYKSIQKTILKDKIEIWPLGDIHLMSIACDKEKLHKIIEKIRKRSNAYWIGMGDYAELIYPGDPRMDYSLLDDIADVHAISDIDLITEQKVIEILSPIKHRCIAILDGNHELTRNRRLFRQFGKKLGEALGVPYLGYEGYITLLFGKHEQIPVTIWVSHGFGGGRKWGSHIDRLREMTQSFNADIYLAAHNHDIGAFRDSVLENVVIDGKIMIRERERLFVRTGSFRKRINTSYESRAGYSMQPTGVPHIMLERTNSGFEMHAVV